MTRQTTVRDSLKKCTYCVHFQTEYFPEENLHETLCTLTGEVYFSGQRKACISFIPTDLAKALNKYSD